MNLRLDSFEMLSTQKNELFIWMYPVNGLMFATNQSVKGRRCEGQGFVIFIVNIIIVKVKKCGELFMTPCQFYGPREDLTNGPK